MDEVLVYTNIAALVRIAIVNLSRYSFMFLQPKLHYVDTTTMDNVEIYELNKGLV